MPQLDFALLAIAATGDGETFNMLGAGVEQVRIARLPAAALIHLVARWDWTSDEAGRTVRIGVSCRSLENGEVLHESTFPVEVSAQHAMSLPGHLLTVLPLTLQSHGRHVVELTAERTVLKVLPFTVLTHNQPG